MSKLGRTFQIWHFLSYRCDYCSCDMSGNEKDCEYCEDLRKCISICEEIDKEYEMRSIDVRDEHEQNK